MLRDDYLMRQVERLGQAVAQAMALCRKEDHGPALDEVRQALGEALGPRARLVESVDAATAVALLGAPELVVAVASLLAQEAQALEGLGRRRAAEDRRRRAMELLEELPELDDRGQALLREVGNDGTDRTLPEEE